MLTTIPARARTCIGLGFAVVAALTFTQPELAARSSPIITGIIAGSLTTSAATITWTTDKLSDSQVDYGVTTAYGSSSPLNASPVTSHSVGLSGLTASTTYHFRVRSRASGNVAV